MNDPRTLPEISHPAQEPDYARVFERVEAQLGDLVLWVSEQKQRANELSGLILSLPDRAAREKKVRDLARIEPWAVTLALLTSAMLIVQEEPERSATLAELAAAAAEEMDDKAHPSVLKTRLLGQAALLEAISRFHSGGNAEAHKALEAAELYFTEAFPGGPRSRTLSLLSSLRELCDKLNALQKVGQQVMQRAEEQLLETSLD